MASSIIRKYCTNKDGCKQAAAAVCEGCSQPFCTMHFTDHRRFLSREMELITSEYDQFQHTINEQKTVFDSKPFLKQVDEWEKESITKTQQKAQEIRHELIKKTNIHLEEISNKFQGLSEKLKQAREHDTFIETDLDAWKKSFDNLNANLNSVFTVQLFPDDTVPLVHNILIDAVKVNDVFDQVYDHKVRLEENGQVAVHDISNGYTEIRGKNEYTSGHHKVRLCIEQSSDTWTFLGINSKSTAMQNLSYNSKSTYGWTNNNYIWLNGQPSSNLNSTIEMSTSDIITLIFDCNNCQISMINERTHVKSDLIVNLDYCPLPWQLNVILYEPNSRMRILPTLP